MGLSAWLARCHAPSNMFFTPTGRGKELALDSAESFDFTEMLSVKKKKYELLGHEKCNKDIFLKGVARCVGRAPNGF